MLAHKLALEIGCTSPEIMLESMTSRELTSWHAFDAISPIGRERLDYLAAAIMSTVVNSQPFRGKGPAARLSDFIVQWKPDPEQQQQKIRRAAKSLKQLWSRVQGNG